MALSFKRWELDDNRSVAAIFQGCRRGIYVLEFENDERYVGQTDNIVVRYNTHRHRSTHHTPWKDITAINFLEIPEGDLDQIEFDMIQAYRTKYRLRNKTFNFGHSEPSPLDDFISVENQEHWATGQPVYELKDFTEAVKRPSGELPKLLSKRRGQEQLPDGRMVWEAIIDDLAVLIPLVIPSAVKTEGKFWSLSDYPSTAGGRFVTLNVGRLELAFYPRARFEPEFGSLDISNGMVMRLNAMIETFILPEDVPPEFSPDEELYTPFEFDGKAVTFYRMPNSYSMPVDSLEMPLGCFRKKDFEDEDILGIRQLAIHAMRAGSARVNARSYSAELTRLVYKRALELNG